LDIRQKLERAEELILSPYACLSKNSKGRLAEEEKCDLRTEFSRDRDRIIHSKAFRRLKHKTQVFISPGNDHYRTRLTHTLEVSQIATTISKALMLNTDLTEAISMGHDIGHTPFGHMGETVLNELCPEGYKHYEQSLRICDVIERDGRGLNLTYEVRDGILNHSGDNTASTFEGKIIKFADRFAYINHDIDDAIRAKMISDSDIPELCVKLLGNTNSERIDTLIKDLIFTTTKEGEVSMSNDIENAMMELRQFMFERVYYKLHDHTDTVRMIIGKMYEYYYKDIDRMPDEYKKLLDHSSKDRVVCDLVSSMTDDYIIHMFNELFISKALTKF